IQPDSIGQIIEILDARLVVETEIARKAAEKAEAPDVEALQAILDHHSSGQHGGGAIDAFVECDRAFHVKISEM
ncbi:FCD domain-containing protein, partial [Stenotrophomonas maltophilia]|uniref:FCD domain-containing protein n=1 Tax=Stenotrophomonas maltophilia TaxID=40324 RepID=UPI0013DC4775